MRKERMSRGERERAGKLEANRRRSLSVGKSQKERGSALLLHRCEFKSCSGLTSSVNRAASRPHTKDFASASEVSVGLSTLRVDREQAWPSVGARPWRQAVWA